MYLKAKTLKIYDYVWFDDDSRYVPINSLYRRNNSDVCIYLTISNRQMQWIVEPDKMIRVRKIIFAQYVKTGDHILYDNKVWYVQNRGYVPYNTAKLSLVPYDDIYTKPIDKIYNFKEEIVLEDKPCQD